MVTLKKKLGGCFVSGCLLCCSTVIQACHLKNCRNTQRGCRAAAEQNPNLRMQVDRWWRYNYNISHNWFKRAYTCGYEDLCASTGGTASLQSRHKARATRPRPPTVLSHSNQNLRLQKRDSMDVWVHTHTHECTYVCMHACMHVCMHACMYECMNA